MQLAVYQSDFMQRAIADTTLAIEDVTRAMEIVQQRPELAALSSSHTAVIQFTPPSPAGAPALSVALNNLNTALERLSSAPGGDLGGLRAKLVSGMATAAHSVIAAMVHANEERERSRNRRPGATAAAPAPPAAPAPSGRPQ